MNASLSTAVVILNWNGAAHLATYLPSVVEHSAGARIVVADNGSTDGSEGVVAGFTEVEWLALRQNYGFAEGYNQALGRIPADVYVLLNSDVRVSAQWLQAPLDLLARDERIAAVQPKILADARPESFEYAGAAGGYLDSLGYPYCRGRIFDTIERDVGQYDDVVQVDWASGACCFIRASAWRAVGGLDGNFFAHMEEIDLCWRLRRADYVCVVTPASVVYHLGGGTLAYLDSRKTYLNFRNSLATLVKNLPVRRLLPVLLVRLLLDGVAAIKFLLSGKPRHFSAIFIAHLTFYVWLPELWRGRAGSFGDKLSVETDHQQVTSIVWQYFVRGRKTYAALPKCLAE